MSPAHGIDKRRVLSASDFGPKQRSGRTQARCFTAVSWVPLPHPGRWDFPSPVGNEGMSTRRLPTRLTAPAVAGRRRACRGLLLAAFDRCARGLPGSASWPLAPDRAAFAQGSCAPQALPSCAAPMSPGADPRASHLPFVPLPYRRGPCCSRHPQLVPGTVPTLLCPSVLQCHAPDAGGSSSAPDQFFPDAIGLHLPIPVRLAASLPPTASRGRQFSARQTFPNVVALQVACPPDRSAPHCAAPEDVVHSSFPPMRYLLDSRICYPADWSIAGAGLPPARRAAGVGCTMEFWRGTAPAGLDLPPLTGFGPRCPGARGTTRPRG